MHTARLTGTPDADHPADPPGGNVALVAVGLAWALVLVLYLRHAIVLSSDSINNHVHVWWVADRVWHHGRLPWRFPLLGHGDAYAYPYGFVNWTTAALAWPLFGDWTVTLWTVLGTTGCAVATFVAFPELRRGWWAAAVLANSALVQMLLFGQQSFAWASMCFLFGIAAWRRDRRGWAVVLVGVAQATHVVIVAPMVLVIVLLVLPFASDRWKLVQCYALSCLFAVPALYIIVTSPAYADAGPASQIVNFFGTIGPRILIVVLPIFYVLLRGARRPWFAPLALVVSLGFNLLLFGWMNVRQQVDALTRDGADTATLDAYLDSSAFVPGATYRVLRGGDGKLGLYHVVRAGGQLDAELFPESMAIRSFTNVADYERLLCDRHVDQVLHYRRYDTSRRTNEYEMIAALAAGEGTRVSLEEITRGDDYAMYRVDRAQCG